MYKISWGWGIGDGALRVTAWRQLFCPRLSGDGSCLASIGIRAARVLLVMLAIGFVSWCSLAYLRISGTVSLGWASSGLLVGILVVLPTALWPELFAAAAGGMIVARAIEGEPLFPLVGFTAAALVECIVVAGAIRRRVPDPADMSVLGRLSQTAIVSTFVGCALSALIALACTRNHAIAWQEIALQWFAAHVLGMVVIATLTLVVVVEGRRLLGAPGKRWKLLLGLVFVAATTTAVFSQERYPLLFLVFTAQLWLTYSEGWRGVVIGVLLLSLIAGAYTTSGSGPLYIRSLSSVERVFLFQVFVGAICLVTWPVAIGRTQRARLTAELSRRERKYRLLATNLRDLIVHLRADGKRLFVSDSARAILGYEPEELMEPRWELVHPEDQGRVRDALARAFESEGLVQVVFRALHKEGHYIWLDALAHRVDSDTAGGIPEIV